MSKRISSEHLTSYCNQVLNTVGVSASNAQVISNVLVTTDLWGTFSHGTGALRNYVRALKVGVIDVAANPEVKQLGNSWTVVDGHASMGMLSASLGMELAIEKAAENTISWVGVTNSSHFGAAGYYANMAAQRGMIGIAMSNADPNMVVPGARGHVIGNNPLAYAIPAGKEHPILLDIALSAVAAGKIFAMKAEGKSIPDTWLTDAEGLPISQVGDWPNSGSMVPMAGHKGYGLALLIEIMAGALTGAGVLNEAKSWILQSAENTNLGHAFIAINVDQIIPIDRFKDRVDRMIQQLRNSPRAKGSERIYVPGEIEWQKREDYLAHGIPLPELVFESLYQVGHDLGLDTALLG